MVSSEMPSRAQTRHREVGRGIASRKRHAGNHGVPSATWTEHCLPRDAVASPDAGIRIYDHRAYNRGSQASILTWSPHHAVTIELKDVPWDLALHVILETHGLGAEVDGRLWLIAPPR
jgi:hypothetical protein